MLCCIQFQSKYWQFSRSRISGCLYILSLHDAAKLILLLFFLVLILFRLLVRTRRPTSEGPLSCRIHCLTCILDKFLYPVPITYLLVKIFDDFTIRARSLEVLVCLCVEVFFFYFTRWPHLRKRHCPFGIWLCYGKAEPLTIQPKTTEPRKAFRDFVCRVQRHRN